jgi:hypothetical protein
MDLKLKLTYLEKKIFNFRLFNDANLSIIDS